MVAETVRIVRQKGYIVPIVAAQEIEIRPRPVGDLTYVRASTETLYGKVAVDWTRENGVFTLKVTIPVGCTARVFLPDEKEPKIVESGTYSFKK